MHNKICYMPVMNGGNRNWHTSPGLWRKLKPVARRMRMAQTPAEAALWDRLRGKKLEGLRFRRQHTIDRFVVDFFCSKAKLVVELDGPIHNFHEREDTARQAHLLSHGIRVLRFRNEEVEQSVEEVLDKIANAANVHMASQR